MIAPYTTEQGKRMTNRFRIYQDIYEVFYIEDTLHWKDQSINKSYKIGHEEDVNYEDVLKIVDLLNARVVLVMFE